MKIINRWNETYNRFKEKGLGMRVAGETSCFFNQNKVRELLRYEYALHRVISNPIEVLCAYNIQTIVKTGYTDMIMPLVRAHGKAIFTAHGGSVVLEPEAVEDTDVEKLFATARSGLPSPFRSPRATDAGRVPVGKSVLSVKAGVDAPGAAAFSRTDTEEAKWFATTRSDLPSPSRSPTATE